MHLTFLFSLLSKEMERQGGKKYPCFIFRFSHSSCHAPEKTQERWDGGQIHFTLVQCIYSHWTTMAWRILQGHGGVWSVVEMESAGGLIRRGHTFSPLARGVKTSSPGNHLTHFHPISTAECVHFHTNGMSFCWSLWSRINPGIKTDFPGSNLPSSIDFFTLTEPVLPNLTWQPAAQWTGSTLASHRGSPPPPPLPLHDVKDRSGGRKKDSQMYKTKNIAYRKHRDKASIYLF